MNERRRSRASAAVLAAVFVIGTLGFSTADALAYHRAGVEHGLTQPHYEPAGSSCGHADRCVLGVTMPGPRAATPLSEFRQPALIRVVRAYLPSTASLPGPARHPLPQPRAPPVPAA
jgi:hypothetical protein